MMFRYSRYTLIFVLVLMYCACSSPEDPSKRYQNNVPAPEPPVKQEKARQLPPSLKEKATAKQQDFGPQPTPRKALEAYAMVLSKRIKRSDLGVYSPETQRFLSQWKVTDQQQRNELNDLLKVFDRQETHQTLDRAVIRFPIKHRHAAPYFFSKGAKGWMLDLNAMNKNIGFNHKNQWFLRNQDHSFMFGFDDWRFDTNGFPTGKK